jgi:hypothetical protein
VPILKVSCNIGKNVGAHAFVAPSLTVGFLPPLLDGPFVFLRPPVLSQLNQIKGNGQEQQDMNRATLLQHKRQHKPNS